MAGQSIPFQIGQNSSQSIAVPFQISHIVIDNPGTYWVHFPQSAGGYAYIWPNRFGAVVPPPIRGPGTVNVNTVDIPPGQVAGANTAAVAQGTIYELDPLAGASYDSVPNPGQALATLDTVAGDIKPDAVTAAAGAIGLGADAGHVHPFPTHMAIGGSRLFTAISAEMDDTVAYAGGVPSITATQLEVVNLGADTASMFVGIQLNLPSGANRVAFIGAVSRGVGVRKSDLVFMGDDGAARGETLRLTAEGHLVSTGALPTLGALQANVASQSILSATDVRGRLTFTTGNPAPVATSAVVVVNFANAYAATPYIFLVNENSSPNSASPWAIGAPSVNGFTIETGVNLAINTAYTVSYWVVG